MSDCSISYLWREPSAAKGFVAGVSLHSHTNQSRETLDFIAELSTEWSLLQPLMRWCEQRCHRFTGIHPDYTRSFWTPPLTPRLAFDLERSQIEDRLQLPGLVSLTDHDDITAPLLLRSVASAENSPISVEWTVPYGNSAFHLGVHNLPAASAPDWMARFAHFTSTPAEQRPPALLPAMLRELNDLPNLLLIFNHPLWDLYRIGPDRHSVLVNDFLAVNGQFIHALELNGLREWKENRAAATLAAKWNQLVISGGDRHGIEPNANINLTHASTFDAFVHEVRRERRSHILFMPQYAEPWKQRILGSTIDAIRDYPHFPQGSQRWDERAYHPDAAGDLRPLAELWVGGKPPAYLSLLLTLVRAMGSKPVSSGLRLALCDAEERHAAETNLVTS